MTDSKKPWKRDTCIPTSLEFLNINYDLIQNSYKNRSIHNHLYKPCDSFAKKDKCLKTGIPPSLERAMCAEMQLKMDGSQVEFKPLRSQSSNKNTTESNDCSYIKERKSVSESLSSLHKNFIWNDCLQPVKACIDCTSDSPDCTCHLVELPTTCESKTGHQLCAASVDLCLEGATQKLSVACSAHSISRDNFTGKMPSKPILSHFENCTEGYVDETEEDFSRSKKERSTLLIRRFCKNDKKIKKSVYTGTRAIVKTLPSGHIGVLAWSCVNHWRKHNELKHHRVVSELKCQNSVTQQLSSYLLQSIYHEGGSPVSSHQGKFLPK